ncbi:NAD-dependent epimerase/dehydratase family protein [Rhizobium sp. R693]|uniref:NAD-dependent epimerase/dehydratase family protein n=1 Tax=Rhizobium sp. R693 TaxID=1764276 RepID=UPI000B7348A7|nr:NAD-dependent epimerase/dehydratase family protein [Rhizobium sp. R693]OWV83275.1 hypothetical protein ATY79_14965 [Rhizobium sp. R693]
MPKLAEQRCLVMGGSGFLGTNLCRALAGRAREVRAFSRHPVEVNNVTCVQGDFAERNDVMGAVEGIDTVFHLISTNVPATSNLDLLGDASQNILPSIQLLDACRIHKVARVVFVSSGGTVYGEVENLPIPESHTLAPISGYGICKLAIERYLHLYEKMHGIVGITLRVSNPYGPFQEAKKKQGVMGHFISSGLRGQAIEIWGDGSVVRDYIYIDDVVEGLMLAAEYTGQRRTFNVGSGKGYSLNEIIAAVSRSLGINLDVRYEASRAVDISKNILDCSLAAQELGWRGRYDLATGIDMTVAWFRDHAQPKI